MKIYLVGGAVRDQLMGRQQNDNDYVIVDVTPEELARLGFRPVGNAFTIFLHPVTKEEYTLAKDLKDDLHRRDLTINAMASDPNGDLYDPFSGKIDIKNKVLRHVSEQTFSEDALRVYRVARFKSIFPEFKVHPETLKLMSAMVKREAFRNLPGERIFGELRKALRTHKPSLFFAILREVNCIDIHFAGVDFHLLDNVEGEKCRYAWLLSSLDPKRIENLSQRLLVPNDWLELALALRCSLEIKDPLELIYKVDGFRHPHLIDEISYCRQLPDLRKNFELIKDISRKDVAPDLQGKDIFAAIRKKREEVLKRFLDCDHAKK